MTSDTEWTPGTRWAPQTQKDKLGLKTTKDLHYWRGFFFLARIVFLKISFPELHCLMVLCHLERLSEKSKQNRAPDGA